MSKSSDGRWWEVFRAGSYPQGDVSEADVQQLVDNYDPSWREAPVVVGHPKSNDPAYGWIKAVRRKGLSLLVQFRDMSDQLIKAVREGLYRKVSIRIMRTGRGLYLGHVGFLGAVQPAVPGLARIQFEDNGEARDFEVDFTAASSATPEPGQSTATAASARDLSNYDKARLYQKHNPGTDFATALEAAFDGRADGLSLDVPLPPHGELSTREKAELYQEHNPGVGFAEALFAAHDGKADFLVKKPDEPEDESVFHFHGAVLDTSDVGMCEESAELHRRIAKTAEENPGMSYEEAWEHMEFMDGVADDDAIWDKEGEQLLIRINARMKERGDRNFPAAMNDVLEADAVKDEEQRFRQFVNPDSDALHAKIEAYQKRHEGVSYEDAFYAVQAGRE